METLFVLNQSSEAEGDWEEMVEAEPTAPERSPSQFPEHRRKVERPLPLRACRAVSFVAPTRGFQEPRVAEARSCIRSVPSSVQHPGSAAKAALNDCPHDRKAKGAHLAAFVSCSPLFDSTLLLALHLP